MAKPHFETHISTFEVRDYELDLQGIVNNAVYFNYLEHARHSYLLDKGVSFQKLFDEGIAAMVLKAEMEYKSSLRSKDKFEVETYTEKKGRFKLVFHQNIRKLGEEQVILKAQITTACINIDTRKPEEIDW